jgi:hypothetical protein
MARYPEARPHRPPLTNGFFDDALLDDLGYAQAQQDLREVIPHIQKTKLLTDPFGEGPWKSLNLEDVFTAIEVERDFHSPESDDGAHLTLLRNALVRYIRRVIGLCTQGARGEYYKLLASRLEVNDSIVTFNWDLLLDQEFTSEHGRAHGPYGNFLHRIPLAYPDNVLMPAIQGEGLFLKLHGSLNWFRCGNNKCQASGTITLAADTQQCLRWNAGDEDVLAMRKRHESGNHSPSVAQANYRGPCNPVRVGLGKAETDRRLESGRRRILGRSNGLPHKVAIELNGRNAGRR